MFNAILSGVMDYNPELTTHGFGVDSEWDNSFTVERAKLYDVGEEFDACREWLSGVGRTKNSNHRIGTSYRLKHVVERWFERKYHRHLYINEGSFIAAAISLGFAIKRIPKKTSVFVGISSKSM